MNKKQFIKIMSELISLKKDEDNLNKAFKKFEPDFNYISFVRYESLIVKTLEASLDDTSSWISYWLYDLDCGKNAKHGTVKSKEGKNIPIKTAGNLFDLIKSDY